MTRAVIVVCGVLVGWTVALGQAGGKGAPAESTSTTKAQAKLAAELKAILGTGEHAKTAAWAAARFEAARSAQTERDCDRILLALKTRLEQIVKTAPTPKAPRDRVDLLALTGWLARIEGCARIRLPVQRLLAGWASKDDRRAVLAASRKALDLIEKPIGQAGDIEGTYRTNMRHWIICGNHFAPALATISETRARLLLYSGLAEHNATLRKLQLTKALKACPSTSRADPAASGRAAILNAHCLLALGGLGRARAVLEPLTAESRKIDASTIRARLLLARCALADNDAKNARRHVARARATLPAIFTRNVKALLDAELCVVEHALPAEKTGVSAEQAEQKLLDGFLMRNLSNRTVLASLLGLAADSPGLFLQPAVTVVKPGNVTYANTSAGFADNVVFVVDRSGSMVTVFDYVRLEIQLAIAQLHARQKFHIVLFADAKAIDGPAAGLVSATPGNKISVVEFLNKDEIRPQGKTTVLVSLKRAFDVLDRSEAGSSKMIILVTDGEFSGIGGGSRYAGMKGNEAVIKWLKVNNAKSGITINTYLFGKDPRAVKVLKQIADEHKGRFKAIDFDE